MGGKERRQFCLATETHWKNVPRKDDFAQSPFVLIEKLCSPNEPKAARFHSDWTIEEQTANTYRQNTFLRHKRSRRTRGPGGLENTGKQKTLICKRLPKSEPANKTAAIAICSCKLQNKMQKIQQGFCDCKRRPYLLFHRCLRVEIAPQLKATIVHCLTLNYSNWRKTAQIMTVLCWDRCKSRCLLKCRLVWEPKVCFSLWKTVGSDLDAKTLAVLCGLQDLLRSWVQKWVIMTKQ